MAQFPYLVEDYLDSGATTGSETDASSRGTIMHYAQSARMYGIVPYRGSYCYVMNLTKTTQTNSPYITYAVENVAATNYYAVGVGLYMKDISMTTTNRHSIIQMKAGATVETCVDLLYTTAGGLQLVLDETGSGTTVATVIDQNRWHWIELHGVIDPGANNGTANLVLDGITIGGLTSLDQGNITDMLVGAIGTDAGSNGLMAIDHVIASGIDTSAVRVGYRKRYPWNVHISAIGSTEVAQQIFVGPGTVSNVDIIPIATGDHVDLYDTDDKYTTGAYANLIASLVYDTTTPITAGPKGPWVFDRGCYATIHGGAGGARAIVRVDPAPPCGYPKAICYGNDAVLKNYAINGRKNTAPDV